MGSGQRGEFWAFGLVVVFVSVSVIAELQSAQVQFDLC